VAVGYGYPTVVPISPDGYVSVRGSQQRDFGEPTHAQPVILVDLDVGKRRALRLPPAFLAQREATVLFRLSDPVAPAVELPRSVKAALEDWKTVKRAGVLTHPLGAAAEIKVIRGADVSAEEQKEIIARARAVELEALLEFGQAIWRPTTFHYRLITGEHADSYVKLGDALRHPRDAEVLASWLHEHVEPKLGLILDTGTLTPIAQALRLAAVRGGIELGPSTTLENYPRTVMDVGSALDRVSGDAGRVMALISVSSSGSLLERVLDALQRKGSSMEGRVAVLVNKTGRPSWSEIDVWTPLVGQKPLVASGPIGEIGCELCRTPGRATVVPINPFTFDAMLPTQLKLVVPDVNDPAENRPLWEAGERNSALSVEQKANPALRRYRSDKVPMGIKMEAARLIGDETFRAKLRQRLADLQGEEGMPLDGDLVLAPEHERKHPGYPEFWEAIHDSIAPDVEDVTPFPIDADFDDSLIEKVRRAKSILVFQLGTVSGASIQRALVGVQSARGDDDGFKLNAFVLHARPATRLELKTIRNSFGHAGKQPQMRFGWTSILPDRSPLRDELILLRSITLAYIPPNVRTFLTKRIELCGGRYTGETPPPVLWGSKSDSFLTPNAIYGHALGTVATYVAVGSAMSAALAKPEQMTPELRVFEVASLARSYYDPLILGCMLRWMRPHEIFWGWTGTEATATALHILDRAENLGREILVPEMLLAAAQGKLTREAATATVRVAEGMRTDSETSAETAAILEAGLHLVGDLAELSATEGLYNPSSFSQ